MPDQKRAARNPHIMSQSSTVTVVLLTLEALVVALVADVVATYSSKDLDRKEAKEIEPREGTS